MKLFLDENITPKAKPIFEGLGYDVESVHSYQRCGIDDDKVLEIAINESRVLITQNGKDFVVQIPPRVLNNHYGLIWVRFHVTRANINNVCNKIHAFLVEQGLILNSIWKVENRSDPLLSFIKRHPQPTMAVSY